MTEPHSSVGEIGLELRDWQAEAIRRWSMDWEAAYAAVARKNGKCRAADAFFRGSCPPVALRH